MPRCTVPDPVTGKACGRPTMRAAKQGLSAFMCRKHVLHRQRHGSAWCPSPSAAALRPYLKAALSHVNLHRAHDPYVRAALAGLSELMASAGQATIATRLKGLTPDQRARVALARLREKGTKPARLIAIVLAVHALIDEAPATVHRTREFRIVAIAKAAHRLASGTHRRWRDDQGKVLTEMHSYPRSAGRVLRSLGAMLEQACELVIDHHLAAVLVLKLKRYGPHPANASAAGAKPSGTTARLPA